MSAKEHIKSHLSGSMPIKLFPILHEEDRTSSHAKVDVTHLLAGRQDENLGRPSFDNPGTSSCATEIYSTQVLDMMKYVLVQHKT